MLLVRTLLRSFLRMLVVEFLNSNVVSLFLFLEFILVGLFFFRRKLIPEHTRNCD